MRTLRIKIIRFLGCNMIIDPKEQSFQENHKLMIGSIVPRPIALVSTISKGGVNNLAPFSYFNGVCSKPPTVMFAPARRGWDGNEKDTLVNIRESKEFTINIVSESFVEKMVICGTDFDPSIDEFDSSKLIKVSSKKVKPPVVKQAKVSFECILTKIVQIGVSVSPFSEKNHNSQALSKYSQTPIYGTPIYGTPIYGRAPELREKSLLTELLIK